MDDFLASLRLNQRLTTWLQYAVVGAMMACVAAGLVQIGRVFSPGMDRSYPVVLGFLFALEAFTAHRMRRGYWFPQPGWFAFYISEWVVMLVVIKVFQFATHGTAYLWIELQGWRADFFATYFNSEFLFSLIVAAIVWVMSIMIAEPLDVLRVDEKQLQIEQETGLSQERAEARRQIVDFVLFVGVLMVLMTSLLRNELTARWFNMPAMRLGVVNAAVYFSLGLVLLSLTQFNVLQMRWSVNRVTISPRVASRWFQYSLIFLLLLAGMVLILPTGYSRSLLTALNWLMQVFIALLFFIYQLVTLPFLLIAALLGLLSGEPQPLNFEPPAPIPTLPVEQNPPAPAAFLEIFRTVLTTTLIIALVLSSFYFYIRARREHITVTPGQGLLGWLASLWSWIAAWLVGAGKIVLKSAREGVQKLVRPSRPAGEAPVWGYLALRNLTSRQRVLFYYLALVRRGSESGIPRRPPQTPYEYAASLSAGMEQAGDSQGLPPAPGEDIRLITESFVEAHYSRHEISDTQAEQVRSIWERLRRLLQRRRRKI